MMDYYALSELTCEVATELDNYLLQRGQGFSALDKFRDYLRKNLISDNSTYLDPICTPFHVDLANALREKSGKEIKHMSELALEMRLLYNDLGIVRMLPNERISDLRSFFTIASIYIHASAVYNRFSKRRLSNRF